MYSNPAAPNVAQQPNSGRTSFSTPRYSQSTTIEEMNRRPTASLPQPPQNHSSLPSHSENGAFDKIYAHMQAKHLPDTAGQIQQPPSRPSVSSATTSGMPYQSGFTSPQHRPYSSNPSYTTSQDFQSTSYSQQHHPGMASPQQQYQPHQPHQPHQLHHTNISNSHQHHHPNLSPHHSQTLSTPQYGGGYPAPVDPIIELTRRMDELLLRIDGEVLERRRLEGALATLETKHASAEAMLAAEKARTQELERQLQHARKSQPASNMPGNASQRFNMNVEVDDHGHSVLSPLPMRPISTSFSQDLSDYNSNNRSSTQYQYQPTQYGYNENRGASSPCFSTRSSQTFQTNPGSARNGAAPSSLSENMLDRESFRDSGRDSFNCDIPTPQITENGTVRSYSYAAESRLAHAPSTPLHSSTPRPVLSTGVNSAETDRMSANWSGNSQQGDVAGQSFRLSARHSSNSITSSLDGDNMPLNQVPQSHHVQPQTQPQPPAMPRTISSPMSQSHNQVNSSPASPTAPVTPRTHVSIPAPLSQAPMAPPRAPLSASSASSLANRQSSSSTAASPAVTPRISSNGIPAPPNGPPPPSATTRPPEHASSPSSTTPCDEEYCAETVMSPPRAFTSNAPKSPSTLSNDFSEEVTRRMVNPPGPPSYPPPPHLGRASIDISNYGKPTQPTSSSNHIDDDWDFNDEDVGGQFNTDNSINGRILNQTLQLWEAEMQFTADMRTYVTNELTDIAQSHHSERELRAKYAELRQQIIQSNYILQNKVGSGGFGAVYRGIYKKTGGTVAIKVINLEDSNEDVSLINREIAILAQANKCPQLISYVGSEIRGTKLWIAMEFVDGGSVHEAIKRFSSLEEKYIAVIVREVLLGLQYLASENKIHRDIKAANVLLGSDGAVKLADFGASRSLSDTLSTCNTFVGSPYWMAPEVMMATDYNGQADIWSLGIFCLEMAYGKPPHTNNNHLQVMQIIVKESPPTLQGTKWSSEFRDFVSMCLVKNPQHRAPISELLKTKFIKNSKKTKIICELIGSK